MINTTSPENRTRALVLFVDAFAYDYLASRPFLPGFWQQAAPLESLIGYSSAIVPALWSGLLPDQSNIWNEFFYRPKPPYRLMRWLDRAPHRYLRNFLLLLVYRLTRQLGAYREWSPAIPSDLQRFFGRNDIRYHDFPPIPLGRNGLDQRLHRAGLSFSFAYPPQFKASRAMGFLRNKIAATDVFIYGTGVIDDAGHAFGPNPKCFEPTLRELEEFVVAADDLFKQWGESLIVIVSDHGMTEVTSRFNLCDWLQPWQLGEDYVAFLDSTMARFWDVGQISLERIIARVDESKVGRFLTPDDCRRFGLAFSDNRYGDAVFLLNPGCVLSPSFMDALQLPFWPHHIRAMHGYSPDEPSTRAVFLYHGASPLPFLPTRVTEVADLLEQLLCRLPQSVGQG